MSCSGKRPAGQEEPGGDLGSQWRPSDENEAVPVETVACDRCRQRKIKCNRVNPCTQCVAIDARCTYMLGRKGKEKRQRVLISSVYEKRLEHISDKIDELSEIVKRLADDRLGALGFRRGRIHSSHQSSDAGNHCLPSSQTEGIESTLFTHAVFATGNVQSTVMGDPNINFGTDITSALDALWTTVNVQKQQNETIEGSRPFLKQLPSGQSFRGLPIPPLEKIMSCLRIAYESSPSQLYWPFEFGSLGDFNQYVFKAFLPGPITDPELIIVHYVLFWLFTQCSLSAEDKEIRQDYELQSLVCKESLETILSNLSIHIDTDIDSVCSMYMATLHSLHCGKVFGAWTFISKASLMSQALGLHSSHTLSTEPDKAQRKMHLFWAVYVLEKSVSLRLGRSSTIRDKDITVPRLHIDRNMASLAYNRMPDWIDVATFHGRVYDDLYSPNALTQPPSVRASRATSLGSELKQMIASRDELYKRPDQWTSHVIHPGLSMFLIHAYRAIEHSTLASIYRETSSANPSRLTSCPECITAARVSLEEGEACVSIIADVPPCSPSLDLWINEILLLAPFMPFMVLVCHAVETSDSSDLQRLQRLIDGLDLLTRSRRYSSYTRQLRIFKAFYDVAETYTQVKERRHSVELSADQLTGIDPDAYLFDNSGLDLELEGWSR